MLDHTHTEPTKSRPRPLLHLRAVPEVSASLDPEYWDHGSPPTLLREVQPGCMSSDGGHLKDEVREPQLSHAGLGQLLTRSWQQGSKLQVVAAGATAGLISRSASLPDILLKPDD